MAYGVHHLDIRGRDHDGGTRVPLFWLNRGTRIHGQRSRDSTTSGLVFVKHFKAIKKFFETRETMGIVTMMITQGTRFYPL